MHSDLNATDLNATIGILRTLVGFDTRSSKSNLALVDWVRDYLAQFGIPSVLLPDATGTKASLVARIGPQASGGVVLCGHCDVVPVSGQDWSCDPWTLTLRESRVYGRGTTDMKGFIASALAAVPRLVDAHLTRPVTIALTYDEEVGACGAEQLGCHLVEHEPKPALVVVGEPTLMSVVRAHKGVRILRTSVRTRPEHASRTDRATSAIGAAARIISHIEMLGTGSTLSQPGDIFTPPHTTTNVGLIDGGAAANIVASECSFVWEYRTVPGDNQERIAAAVEGFIRTELLPDLQRICPSAEIHTEDLASVSPLDPALNGQAAQILTRLGLLENEAAVSYGTDGSALQLKGLPTVICGPGSMDQGHQADEYIEEEQLRQCGALISRIAEHLSDSGSSS